MCTLLDWKIAEAIVAFMVLCKLFNKQFIFNKCLLFLSFFSVENAPFSALTFQSYRNFLIDLLAHSYAHSRSISSKYEVNEKKSVEVKMMCSYHRNWYCRYSLVPKYAIEVYRRPSCALSAPNAIFIINGLLIANYISLWWFTGLFERF